MSKKKTNEEFLKDLEKANSTIIPLEPYINSSTKIDVHCTVCGNTWKVVPSSLLSGTGCPRCNKRYRKNTVEFIEAVSNINPHISVLGSYVNAHTKIHVRCQRCDYEWNIIANSLLKGNDCPNCSHSQTSINEQILLFSFFLLLGEEKVLSRDRLAIGKELDIYIPSLRLAIEYGAWYWHKGRYESDIEKDEICQRKGIDLISIYEGCPDDIDLSKLRKVYRFSNVLSNPKEYNKIKFILKDICSLYDLDYQVIENNWNSIVAKAKQQSRKKDAEHFCDELSKKNKNVEYVDSYMGSKFPVRVRCKKCGMIWNASSAYDVLHGHGCPQCAILQRGKSQWLSDEEYKSRFHQMNPQFELLSEYLGPHIPVQCKCNICGTLWTDNPNSLIRKTKNCPRCSPVTPLTNDEFLTRIKSFNAQIIPEEEYKNSATKISFRCSICGYRWLARPSDILKGTGCPKCAHRVTMTNDEFREKVKLITQNIEIIGLFTNTKTKVQCRCLKCGNEWMATPSNLLKGEGCPKCGGHQKLTDDEFRNRLCRVNPDIFAIEEYQNSSTKIMMHCRICDYEWRATAQNLLAGHGCPQCKANKAKLSKSKRVLCVETEHEYNSIFEAKKSTNISTISDCLHGRIKTAGGYHWKFI